MGCPRTFPHVAKMNISDVSREKDGCLELDVSVSPRSNRSGPEGFDEWRKRLIIRVRAPPLDGRANREVEETVSDMCGFPAKVTSGQTSRQKTVTIRGDPSEALRRLESCMR